VAYGYDLASMKSERGLSRASKNCESERQLTGSCKFARKATKNLRTNDFPDGSFW